MMIQSQTATNILALIIVHIQYYQQTCNLLHDDVIILTMLMFQHLDDVDVYSLYKTLLVIFIMIRGPLPKPFWNSFTIRDT